MLILLRGIDGIVHMPSSIYLLVWIEQFGVDNLKTLMQSVVLVIQPVGKVVNSYFILFSVILNEEWDSFLKVFIFVLLV